MQPPPALRLRIPWGQCIRARRIDVQACADGWTSGVCASPLSKLGELFGAKQGFAL